MITEIYMHDVASFKHPSALITDKKINLIYGLNGTGKSTISSFLYSPADPRFASCRVTPAAHPPIAVYNQAFIQDNFYVADRLAGIFSLSKENKEAETRIASESALRTAIEQRLTDQQKERDRITSVFTSQKQNAIDQVWKIKTTYSGGDRVLEYCLDGLKGQKEKLFDHLMAIQITGEAPKREIGAIRADVEALQGDTAELQPTLSLILFPPHGIESHPLFNTAILGNSDTEVAALIDSLGNADWVKEGLSYLPTVFDNSPAACPFCQEQTITKALSLKLRDYFDDSYQRQIDALSNLKSSYIAYADSLPGADQYTEHFLCRDRRSALESKHRNLIDGIRANIIKIIEKLRTPKQLLLLTDTSAAVSAFNAEVNALNADIDMHNDRLRNRDRTLEILKSEFWLLMRFQYDQTLSRFEADRHAADQEIGKIDNEIRTLRARLTEVDVRIADAQRGTVNVDAAVDAINLSLLDLGIDDFRIIKHSESRYRVVRTGDSEDAFHTLSEGEKMMISFLYFCELCKGRTSIEEANPYRIVVIDDPISSQSHVFVFNVGQLIRTIFFGGERYSQVFVLTHSLYFFYELTDTNHERRKKTQNLFRLSKGSTGSAIESMRYEEIQNDYQAYWSVVNDPNQPPALVANCMRNIIEYFFGFVRKKDLNNVFQMPELCELRFQAFCRYINRESHSLGQNIMDMKEFDYATFREGLRLIFEKTEYLEHFNAMAAI